MKDILSLREEALEVIVVFPNGDHGSLRGGAILHGLVEFMHASGLSKIIDIELAGFRRRVEELGYCLDVTEHAREFIVDKGFDKQYGARPLKRAIQQYLEDNLAEMILKAEVESGNKIIIDYRNGDNLSCRIEKSEN